MLRCIDAHLGLVMLTLVGAVSIEGCNRYDAYDWDDGSQPVLMADSTSVMEDREPMTSPMVESAPVAPAPEPIPATYTVRRGDTLWSIAQRTYGDGQRWREIIAANPGLDPTKLRIGQQIVVP